MNGRYDARIDLPTPEERKAIWDFYTKKFEAAKAARAALRLESPDPTDYQEGFPCGFGDDGQVLG